MIAKFERIGRTGTTPPAALEVKIPTEAVKAGAEAIAEFLHGYVGRFLISRDYEVGVNLLADRVWIAGGRFGQGVIEREAVDE